MKKLFRLSATVIAVMCAMILVLSAVGCDNGGGKTDKSTTKTETYTVSFETNGGSAVASQTVAKGGVATAPADPAKDGNIFGGWTTDAAGENAYDFATPVTADVKLYAAWIDAATSKTATFYSDAAVYATKYFTDGKRITAPENPAKANALFGGWFTSTEWTEAFSAMKKYTGDQTFYAKWLDCYALEAEWTQLSGLDPDEDSTATTVGNKLGYGRSGEASGVEMISKNDTASNGNYVHGLYYADAYLEFKITCTKAVTDARLYASLSCEFQNYELTESDIGFEVNGKMLSDTYKLSITKDQAFKDYLISAKVSLKEGENVIRFVVVNDVRQFGDGTVYAKAPTVDCLKVYTDASITMTKYNV